MLIGHDLFKQYVKSICVNGKIFAGGGEIIRRCITENAKIIDAYAIIYFIIPYPQYLKFCLTLNHALRNIFVVSNLVTM